MSRSKVLFYTHGLVDGGAERLWACLASAFADRGYPTIFAQDFEADENRANVNERVRLVTFASGHLSSVWFLAMLLRAEKPDVALSAVGGSNLKLLLACAIARSGTIPIVSYHGAREYTTGWLSYISYLGLPVMSRVARRTIAVSEGLRWKLINLWHAAPAKVITILNPVFFPDSAPVPTAAELQQRDDVILSVGRLVNEKDFVTLIRAFAALKRPNAKLVILGKGEQHERLEAEVARHGLQARVEFPGYSKEPWDTYRRARLFVSSSISEPFGNVIVEAMAHGLPVVATACAGPKEILRDGEFGEIVPMQDPAALAAAMQRALEVPVDPMRQRRRADDFSFAVRVPVYEALIREVLAEASPAAVTGPVNTDRSRRPAS